MATRAAGCNASPIWMARVAKSLYDIFSSGRSMGVIPRRGTGRCYDDIISHDWRSWAWLRWQLVRMHIRNSGSMVLDRRAERDCILRAKHATDDGTLEPDA